MWNKDMFIFIYFFIIIIKFEVFLCVKFILIGFIERNKYVKFYINILCFFYFLFYRIKF